MQIIPRSIEQLIEELEKLPGIGPKSASRLAFYLIFAKRNPLAIRNGRQRTRPRGLTA